MIDQGDNSQIIVLRRKLKLGNTLSSSEGLFNFNLLVHLD
jgi:hypothetical protein